MRLSDEIRSNDPRIGMPFNTRIRQRSHRFDARITRRFYFLALQKIQQITPPTPDIQHTFSRQVRHPADGLKSHRLRRRARPQQRPKPRPMPLRSPLIRLKIIGALACHRYDDKLPTGMNKPINMAWLTVFRQSLQNEYADNPRIVTLASVDAKRRPRARSVILRRIDDNGALWITSNAFAAKNAQLREWPFAEITAYLPKNREQFRLSGAARVIGPEDDDALRESFWKSISDAARATFFWPAIGQPARQEDPVPASIDAAVPMPPVFELIELQPDQVEHLATAAIPHRRTRWREELEWAQERINP